MAHLNLESDKNTRGDDEIRITDNLEFSLVLSFIYVIPVILNPCTMVLELSWVCLLFQAQKILFWLYYDMYLNIKGCEFV